MMEQQIQLTEAIEGCCKGDRRWQRKVYELFYGYAMNIALRYCRHREEAVEVLNDAFFKAFSHIHTYNSGQPFKPWIRRILINAAIDFYRAHHRIPVFEDFDSSPSNHAGSEMELPVLSPNEDILPVIQELSPAYRLVFNLYVMEGYKHEEIAEMLGISAGASRSNLARAIAKLREIYKSPEALIVKIR